MASSGSGVEPPLGIVLILKDDTAERILFQYPDAPIMNKGNATVEQSEASCVTAKESNFASSSSQLYEGVPSMSKAWTEVEIPVKMLGPLLLCSREEGGSEFEIKVDNTRFAGHPFNIEGTAHSLAVVFVLGGGTSAHVVDSFQKLSKKIAIAINNEQKRCDYLLGQIRIMQLAHDEFAEDDEQRALLHTPSSYVLTKSGLARHLKEVYDDVCEYGMVDVFIDDCIEVGFCVEPKALLQAGLAPRSSKEVEIIMRQVHPYHGLLFLEDNPPGLDSNPVVSRFLEAYSPSRSLNEISTHSGLLPSQVMHLVRHYLMWARVIVIYPICSTNVYATTQPSVPFSRLAKKFAMQFPQCSLSELCEYFSPPNTLGNFLADSALYSAAAVQMPMIIFLLRNQLCCQLHTFFYLLPALSSKALPICEEKETLLSPRIKTAVNSAKAMSEEMQDATLNLCALSLLAKVGEAEIFWIVSTFVSLISYLNGEHHLEDIMYRMNLDRTTMMRVLDSFAPLIATFTCPDLMLGVGHIYGNISK